MNLPEATRQHMMDQGFAPRTFAMPAAFLHLPGPNLQSQNIRNRKCFKTQEKFNFSLEAAAIDQTGLQLDASLTLPGKSCLYQSVL